MTLTKLIRNVKAKETNIYIFKNGQKLQLDSN